MSTWAESQAELASAVLGRQQASRGLQTAGQPMRGIEVHRNTYRVSLVEALADSFPVTAQLVGMEFFGAMAAEFVARHPPVSPVLIEYGHDLPDFIRRFAPAAAVPCLGDVAALESAWVKAYHAADADTLHPRELQACDPRRLANTRIRFHPSLQFVGSRFPVVSLWSAHRDGLNLSTLKWEPENALILRPTAEVAVYVLADAQARFLGQLLQSQTISDAAMPVLHEAGFDPGSCLLELVSMGAVTHLQS